ncbi:hypothetical protein BS78_03G037000 [Paspalum vaginatum]|nr:hypothetical protein BS78_03G037000 [Paspalum vaginatum]
MADASAPMEPVFAVMHEDPPVKPAPKPAQVQGGGWRVVARRVLGLVFFLATTAAFVASAYRSRHSTRDLTLVIVTQYLGTVLWLCLLKLKQLRGDHTRDAAVVAVELRRGKIAVLVLSAALACTIAAQLILVVRGLALKLVMWGINVLVLGLEFHFVVFHKDAERVDPWPYLQELSPEEKV